MIRKLRSIVARGILLLVVVAGLGFGFMAAAMGVIVGALLLLGFRLALSADAATVRWGSSDKDAPVEGSAQPNPMAI
ncbi:MAG: hypothetical protein FD150_2027 [Rhodobacteraceae bacterium]|nr:MAG: hypothetical protein FD150_2027 [Paracoccaceae bacterium]